MITFIVSLILLVLGYAVYGKVVEKIIGADPKKTAPCYTLQDGVDYIPMPTWKVYLIQFLNIAGTGPIFGAIQGILFGPAAYLWIVLGCIFGGAVHDYMSGMISMKKNGASLPEIVGDELGLTGRQVMRAFTLMLMILVGAVFVTTPAGLLNGMTGNIIGMNGYLFWVFVIIIYYLLATLLPINKIIGAIYPVFGLALLVMAVSLFVGIFIEPGNIPEITGAFQNHHPVGTMPVFPGICITIACGAVSGFHASQSPMMARCMKNEKYGRPVFYGAMITEGVVALIWATAAIKFADSLPGDGQTPYQKLLSCMTDPQTGAINPAVVVNTICHSWLGTFGAVLAILGVVAAPITTGDTAFRCARLIAADILKIKQDKILRRLVLSLPIFAVAIVLMFVKFDVLWRYFGWFNQTLSIFTFWAITVYLAKRGKAYGVSLVPGLFMTLTCMTYILIAPEGFSLPHPLAYALGALLTAICLARFCVWKRNYDKTQPLRR